MQIVASKQECFKCEVPSCGKSSVRVLCRNGEVLRSFDVAEIKRKAKELNAANDARRKSASLGAQKVRLLEDMSRQAVLRLKELQVVNDRLEH